jgi:hypothetical protein
VTFKDEPGEGSGVARSFYTAIAEAILSQEKLPNLDAAQVGAGSKASQSQSGMVMIWLLIFEYLSFFALLIFSLLSKLN